jgi:DNA-binding transcriptional LysR family regulator
MAAMELRRFRYFVAVAECGHFRRAAERLGVAQPALSRQIKLLEEEIGIELFERLPRGIRLSDAGRILLPEARRIVDDLDGALERVRRISTGRTGSLRVAFSEAVSGHRVVTETIRMFRDAEPQVELILQSMVSLQQVNALVAGEIDAGFAYATDRNMTRIVRHDIDVLTLLAALQTGHALANRRKMNLAQLAEGPLIVVGRQINPAHYDSVQRAFAAQGLVPRIVQEANSAVVVNLVAAGMGIGLISSAMRSRLPSGVVLKPISDLAIATPFGLVWRSDNHSPILRRFIDTTVAAAGGHAVPA